MFVLFLLAAIIPAARGFSAPTAASAKLLELQENLFSKLNDQLNLKETG